MSRYDRVCVRSRRITDAAFYLIRPTICLIRQCTKQNGPYLGPFCRSLRHRCYSAAAGVHINACPHIGYADREYDRDFAARLGIVFLPEHERQPVDPCLAPGDNFSSLRLHHARLLPE